MLIFWKVVYNIFFIPLFWFVLLFLSFVNKKAAKGVKGRYNLFEKLRKEAALLGGGKRVWFHSASMGEFEQAKPIISLIKAKQPEVKIIVTFFSPSGYENNIKYKLADLITYLPFDSFFNASKFLDIIKPDIAIFMRYDIWPNFIWQLSRKKITSMLVDATMSKDSSRKTPFIKNFHHHLFSAFSEILTVSEKDSNNFNDFNLTNVKIQAAGDTRYDQVYNRSLNAKQKNLLHQNIIDNKKIFVAGSSWKKDEEILFPAFLKLLEQHNNILMILVPHEPTEKNLEEIEDELKNRAAIIRFSNLDNYKNESIIIVDCIGLLVTLYSYGHAAYVGGGFGDGIHNVLEPAIYGIPVMFGPKNKNAQEASELKKIGCGYEIMGENDIYKNISCFFNNEEYRCKSGKIAYEHVMGNIGASENIFKKIMSYL
jgi:3-deoxy-D-manno-octulosonic-acid transferase